MSKFKSGILLGIGVGVAVAAVLIVLLLRDPIPPLNRADYDVAVARWRDRAASDYDMRVEFSGAQVGDFRVEVRGGEVTRLVRDGQPLVNRGTWQSWTVPGMFEIIEIDLARLERPDADAAGEYRVSVDFDPEWGYPQRYRQIQLGNQKSSEWRITEFSPRTGGG